MRKIFIMLATVVCAAMISNAQIFVGGRLGFNTTGGKNVIKGGPEGVKDETLKGDPDTQGKPMSWLIAPKVGFFLNDDLAVGISIGVGANKTKTFGYNANNKWEELQKQSNFSWELAPFARYYAFRAGKFAVALEAELAFGSTGRGKVTVGSSTTKGGFKTSTLGFNVRPVLAYSVSEKIDLECNLNFLALGYNRRVVKDVESKDDYKGSKKVYSSFDFSVDTDRVVVVAPLTIGAIFKL